MEKIIALNHKMNMEYNQINDYIEGLKKLDLNLVVFPTSIYACDFVKAGFKTGLQNIYFHENGAYTGEVSSSQAKSIGVSYVLLGHSERRMYFHESNKEINQKIKEAIKNNLKVILCVGNNKDDNYKDIIKLQIQECLEGINEEIIIAYEPVWAIGSEETPSNEEIEDAIKYIKSLFNYDVLVLYGGSVNEKTIETLKDVDVAGYLIGSCSTDVRKLEKIKEVVR